MPSIRLAICLLFATPTWVAAQDVPSTQFWLRPKMETDLHGLAPADVKLVAAPDRSREFALLQVGSFNTREYTARGGTDAAYRVAVGGLKVGASPFASPPEEFGLQRFVYVPEPFEGLTLLQTNWWHKAVLDGRYAIVLEAARPCTVFIAIHESTPETYAQYGAPSWLQEYAPTGHRLETNQINYLVFAKPAPAGRIVLGPACSNAGRNWMYCAFFAEAK